MRLRVYKTYWSYNGIPIKRKGTLADLVFDIPYLLVFGVIPPFAILDQTLRSGGDNGGMGPGTAWRPFEITQTQYDELVDVLLKTDLNEARKIHPYISFDRLIIDEEFKDYTDQSKWLLRSGEKYRIRNQ